MNKGQFIVIEGLEGAGKSSAIAVVKDFLQQQGKKLVLTREPGGTPLAEKLRELVKAPGKEVIAAETELLLMYASRVQLVENVIKPALEKGDWVLGDRHDLSSQAYQGGGRQLNAQLIANIKTAVLGAFKPDLTLYLDIDPKIGLQRARDRGALDRIEMEALSFFERTRERYLQLANEDDSILIVNADQSMEKVQGDIIEQLKLKLHQDNA